MYVPMPRCVNGNQKTACRSQFSLAAMWVAGVEFALPGSVVNKHLCLNPESSAGPTSLYLKQFHNGAQDGLKITASGISASASTVAVATGTWHLAWHFPSLLYLLPF